MWNFLPRCHGGETDILTGDTSSTSTTNRMLPELCGSVKTPEIKVQIQNTHDMLTFHFGNRYDTLDIILQTTP